MDNKIEFIGLARSKFNNKLGVRFAIYSKQGYVMMEAESAPVFMSYGAALKGARRALATVRATGKFPNLCATF